MNSQSALKDTAFVITKEYRLFVEFCEACRRYRYIGLCYGVPGVGKTLSARHYAQWDLIETLVNARHEDVPVPAALRDCYTVFYTPTVANTPRTIDNEVRRLRTGFQFVVWDAHQDHASDGRNDFSRPWSMPDPTELLIVDEVDRLKMPNLEQLRDIYDRSHVGLVLIGMPGIEKRMARYPQLYSRVGFVHHFRTLSVNEMHFILAHKWQQLGLTLDPEDFTDHEALVAIIQITGGNFRLIQRLFTQIERILQINQLRLVTKQVVETARENLVIGTV
jgi:DNA transposition AAA+ family ATPase